MVKNHIKLVGIIYNCLEIKIITLLSCVLLCCVVWNKDWSQSAGSVNLFFFFQEEVELENAAIIYCTLSILCNKACSLRCSDLPQAHNIQIILFTITKVYYKENYNIHNNHNHIDKNAGIILTYIENVLYKRPHLMLSTVNSSIWCITN